ncbi:MAG: hypothetical protein RLZZ605_1557, partial [Bacteroidota bacterium]
TNLIKKDNTIQELVFSVVSIKIQNLK